jgi:hypothetical protein
MKAIDTVVANHLVPGALGLPFSLSDATFLAQLASAAGFHEVAVEEVKLSLRVQEPNAVVPMILQGAAAVLPEFAVIPVEERQTMIDGMKADLAQAVLSFMDGQELVMDMATC